MKKIKEARKHEKENGEFIVARWTLDDIRSTMKEIGIEPTDENLNLFLSYTEGVDFKSEFYDRIMEESYKILIDMANNVF
ncbi:MAG: hypothetical protein ACOCQR_02145 [bacterium]